MSGIDKFQWMRDLAADARPTAGEKFILWNIAFVSVRSGEDTFCVRQSTVAERCATSVKTVKRAMGRARSLGYIEISQERQRGQGHHRADEYRLALPRIGDNLSPINEGIGDTDGRNRGHSGHEKGTSCPGIGDTADTLTSGNDTPKGLYKGLNNGLERGTARASADRLPPIDVYAEEEQEQTAAEPDRLPAVRATEILIEAEILEPQLVGPKTELDPEPDLYCDSHMPNGTKQPCGPCKTARLNHETWEKRNQDHIVASLFSVSAPQPGSPLPEKPTYECSVCRDTNIVLDRNGKPGSHTRICHHGFRNDGDRAGRWHLASPEELAEHADLLEKLNKGVA